jgi:hypothetical protein
MGLSYDGKGEKEEGRAFALFFNESQVDKGLTRYWNPYVSRSSREQELLLLR